MIFDSIEIGMKSKAQQYLDLADTLASEFCFGNLFIWKDKIRTALAFTEIGMYVKMEDELGPGCLFPLSEEPEKAIREMTETGLRLIYGAGEKELEFLKSVGAVESAEEDRAMSDYVYLQTELAELSGKKYHSKRNFINTFETLYPDYELFRIDKSNIPDCLRMEDRWLLTFKPYELTKDMCREKQAIRLSFENYEALGFEGMILKVGGETVAFCAGEYMNKDCFVIHTEKANNDYRGSYAFINNAFAKTLKCTYINREDDMGLPGLRKAKESYHPSVMVKKYNVKLKENY